MSDLGDALQSEFEQVKRVRDELEVQIHLGKAEAKGLFGQLEHKVGEIEGMLKLVAQETEKPLHEIGDSARKLLHEIGEGYRRVRKLLP